MSTTRMRVGALISAGVLGLGLSGCGGDDGAADGSESAPASVDEVEGEAGVTEEPQVAAQTQDTEVETSEGGSQASGEGEEFPIDEFLAMVQEPGAQTLASYTMTMAMEADGEAIDADGAVDLSGDQAAMNLTMSMPGLGEVEMITVDGEIYMAMPGVTPEGVYLRGEDDILGDSAALDELDVTSQWDAWEEGAQEVRFLGDEDVEGTELGHYQVTVDAAAAMESMGEDAGDLNIDTVVYDVWLDSDNLMRKLSFDMDGAVAQMSMDNWGEPQQIEAPPADQIMEMDELMGTGGNG